MVDYNYANLQALPPGQIEKRSRFSTRPNGVRTQNESQFRNDALSALQCGTTFLYAMWMPTELMKIGISINVMDRRRRLGGELLALRPGTYDDEAEIHEALRTHRHHGREWYVPAPDVLDAVDDLRQHFNLGALDRSKFASRWTG